MEVGVGTIDLYRLVPDHRLKPGFRLPMELHESRFVLRVHEAEGVDAEPFHEAERTRDRPVRHDPHDHVHGFRRQRDKIPEIIVRRLRLRKGPVRLFLDGMDEVRKANGILDEEHRDVVADDVPVALPGIELYGEAPDVAGKIEGSLAARDGGKTHEGRGLLPGALENVGARIFGKRFIGLEIAMRTVATRMYDPLGNAFVIEMEDLFPEGEILDQRRAAWADLQCVLIVRNRSALRGRQHRTVAFGDLMELAPFPAFELLVVNGRAVALRPARGSGHIFSFRRMRVGAPPTQCGQGHPVPGSLQIRHWVL